MAAPSFQFPILAWYLFNSLKIKIFRHSAKSNIRITKLLKDNANSFRFRFFY